MRFNSAFVFLIALFVCLGASASQARQDKHTALQQSCLLYGNVFRADGGLLPDASVHVRRASEKNSKWEAVSDRRGEFAVRVPPGTDYVIEVRAKGFVSQTKKVTAQAYDRVDMVFHMDPTPDRK